MNEWHDYWSILNGIVASACLVLLGKRFGKHSSKWNTKTRDYWFALTMWCVAGLAISLEGIFRESELGGPLVFVTMGLCVTLKGLVHRGAWGDSSAKA